MTHTLPPTVLVDLDGTLANNISPLYGAYSSFLNHYGAVGSLDEFHQLIGPPIKDIVQILKKRYQLTPSVNELLEQYHTYIEEGYRCSYVLHSGAEQFLEWCHAEGITLILATAAPRTLVLEFLNRNHLTSYFSRVITSDDAESTKINESYYIEALRGRDGGALMIDDSAAVVAAAEKAGLMTYLFDGDWHELMRHFSIGLTETKVTSNFQVEVVMSPSPPLDQETNQLVEELWQEQQRRTPETLFNGKILSWIHYNHKRLVGRFVEYKHYLAQTLNPELKSILNINPVGVTVVVTDGTHVLIGRRSGAVATHNQLFELVPSGSVDDHFLQQGRVILEKLVYEELEEESKLSLAPGQSLRPTHLLCDASTGCCEVCCILVLEKKGDVKASMEHSELLWLPIKQAKSFISENPFTPQSAYILERLL